MPRNMAPASETASASPPGHTDGTQNGRRGKKRVRAFTADERANHRVIEKQRREALNERFLDLARLLPALAHSRRLSKSVIVHESIELLRARRAMCLAAADEIQTILAENLVLIEEVNLWRKQFSGQTPYQPRPLGEAVGSLLKVDQELFGTFPGGFGDNAQIYDGGDIQRDDNHNQTDFQYEEPQVSNVIPIPEPLKFPSVQTDVFSPTFGVRCQPILARSTNLVNTSAVETEPYSTSISSAGQVIPPDPLNENFAFLDNSFGCPPGSNFELHPTVDHFGGLGPSHNMFLNFSGPEPYPNYPPCDSSNFGYST